MREWEGHKTREDKWKEGGVARSIKALMDDQWRGVVHTRIQ